MLCAASGYAQAWSQLSLTGRVGKALRQISGHLGSQGCFHRGCLHDPLILEISKPDDRSLLRSHLFHPDAVHGALIAMASHVLKLYFTLSVRGEGVRWRLLGEVRDALRRNAKCCQVHQVRWLIHSHVPKIKLLGAATLLGAPGLTTRSKERYQEQTPIARNPIRLGLSRSHGLARCAGKARGEGAVRSQGVVRGHGTHQLDSGSASKSTTRLSSAAQALHLVLVLLCLLLERPSFLGHVAVSRCLIALVQVVV